METTIEAVRAATAGAEVHVSGQEGLFGHVSELTRKLHEALRELGYYPDVESAVQALPDARARLDYVSQLTGNAAGRVLASAEQAWDVQKRLESETERLKEFLEAGDDIDEIRHAAEAYAEAVSEAVAETNSCLFEMMLAQDFHDLSGQTIQRIVILARELEGKLSRLLPGDAPSGERVPATPADGLDGPVHNPNERTDVVASQDQVDNLLDSLGL